MLNRLHLSVVARIVDGAIQANAGAAGTAVAGLSTSSQAMMSCGSAGRTMAAQQAPTANSPNSTAPLSPATQEAVDSLRDKLVQGASRLQAAWAHRNP